ncbi:MAG: N-acetyl-gamma-glutamyl-phosphate reductase, partial [Alphaproteobacteria bacterium]|nr:N-acetyl-gamma-glutamyl-phosphate reductase [Alphaproteobacteria bacterium]
LDGLNLPSLKTVEEVDWEDLDVVFCGLPHGTSQHVVSEISKTKGLRIIDLSADFRLRDPALYAKWYGKEHDAIDLQSTAVYGLTEHYREPLRTAQLIACPGCYPTAVLTALLPLVSGGWIDPDDIIIDAKSGVSGAGRGLRESSLFCESGESLSPYGVATHRHAPEIEQELSIAAGRDVIINFTPHLVPMSRGELVTCYVRLTNGATADSLFSYLWERYRNEPFIRVLPQGVFPGTGHVRGSNFLLLSLVKDRIPERIILFAALDNLVKGSSGQALQNMNLLFGFDETTGLKQQPLYP